MALILYQIDLPIKIIDLLFPFGIYSFKNTPLFAFHHRLKIKRNNADILKNRRMEFRIGINLGDVTEEDERIYGDGVNIAARVEGLAEAGGISISGTVYEHIKANQR